jgi:hypothetical protein
MKKDMGKWCEYHKIPWHNTDECCSKKSLMVELKASKSEDNFYSESNPEGGKQIIGAEPSGIVATTKFDQENQKNQRKGNTSFTCKCGSRGIRFIVDNGSRKNLISTEVIKQLDLPTTPHPHPYTIGWLHQGRYLCVSEQGCLLYDVKPFKDEVLCDISPLGVCDVLLGQPYLWKPHAVYESRPHRVIITLVRQLYRIPEVASPTAISLISAKQCSKVIS